MRGSIEAVAIMESEGAEEEGVVMGEDEGEGEEKEEAEGRETSLREAQCCVSTCKISY